MGKRILNECNKSIFGLQFINEVTKNKAINGAANSLCNGITNAKMSKV